MAKQLNIDLMFNANVAAARKNIESLQKALQDVVKLPGTGKTDYGKRAIQEASEAALSLQKHIAAAYDTTSGKLDLSRFQTSLSSSGQNIQDLSNTLLRIGPQGEQAFLKVARSIATAEAPVARINKITREFSTTLKNAFKWQISSSLLHGITGTMQGALRYAEELNQSLNSIRIVTGQSKEEMAEFAKQANDAAKALSTTTVAYTDAALIFAQQGNF